MPSYIPGGIKLDYDELIVNHNGSEFSLAEEHITLKDNYKKMFTTPYDFGAIADGNPHPLSEKYSLLALAQVVYPHATSLTNEIDWCAIQGAINYFGTSEGIVDLGHGKYIINKDITRPRKVTLKGHGMGRAIIKSNSTTVYTIKTVGRGSALMDLNDRR